VAQVTGRTIAARVLERVLEDAAFAAAALDAELARHPELDGRERALATELTYGVLRTRTALEKRIAEFAPKKIKDTPTRVNVLVAAYQLLVLTRIPPFAAVDAAVRAIRDRRGPRLAGFANAVLRKLAAKGERLGGGGAVSAPEWLRERLVAAVGEEETNALLDGAERRTKTALRVLSGRPLPEFLERADGGRVSPRARRVERAGDLRALPGYAEGTFVLQEEGSQAVALLLGARPGERVLDACAGRGQKASLLAEQIGEHGALWATDLHPSKLEALAREFERLRLPPPTTRAVDWSQVPPTFPGISTACWWTPPVPAAARSRTVQRFSFAWNRVTRSGSPSSRPRS
jgi:16S rRNA (cytosine967-C5)-methyltransferase